MTARWFAFYPQQAEGLTSDNDLSCTLLLANDVQTAYLSADIFALAGQRLLQNSLGYILPLLAPHHGSKTSSSIPCVLGAPHHSGIGAAHHVIQRFDQFLFFRGSEKGADLETIASMH